jgi:hypothetical protein
MVLTETMMTPIRRAAICGMLAWALVVPAPRLAEAADPPAAGKKADDADTLFHKGGVAFDAGKMDQAYPLLKAAWALKQTHDIAGNLAQVELALGKYRDAAEHIAYALAHFPPSIQSDRRDKMKKALDEIRPKLGVLTIKINRPEATVSVDGKAIGVSPIAAEVFVEPGAHTVKAELKGSPAVEAAVQVGKGASQEVTLTLEQAEGVTPPPPPVLPPTKEEPRPGPNKAIVLAGAGASGAALVAGVVFTVLANGRASAAREKAHGLITATGSETCVQPVGACGELAGLYHDRVTFSNTAAWSFISAGALGAATGIYALATRSKPKAGVGAAPVVTANGGGFVVGGAW